MTTDTDKLVDFLRANGAVPYSPHNTHFLVTTAVVKRLLDAHIASLCGDVEPVARVVGQGGHSWVVWTAVPVPPDGSLLCLASTVVALKAERDAALARATDWQRLYDRATNVANDLTNYVEDRPELRGAERRLDVIAADARALKGQP